MPFGARGHFLSVICGADLLKMKLSSLAGLPSRLQKGRAPLNQTKLLFPLIFISLKDDSSIVIPPQPTGPGEIMSGGEGDGIAFAIL